LLAWSASLAPERLWALEDCRQLTRALEQTLLAEGERLVRVPPKLMAPQRRAGRARGKSPILVRDLRGMKEADGRLRLKRQQKIPICRSLRERRDSNPRPPA